MRPPPSPRAKNFSSCPSPSASWVAVSPIAAAAGDDLIRHLSVSNSVFWTIFSPRADFDATKRSVHCGLASAIPSHRHTSRFRTILSPWHPGPLSTSTSPSRTMVLRRGRRRSCVVRTFQTARSPQLERRKNRPSHPRHRRRPDSRPPRYAEIRKLAR